MNTTIVFDTLAYAKKLIAAGFTEQQAEVQAETLAEIIEGQVATKRDLKELETAAKHDLKELEQRLIIKLGVMIATSIALTVALIKLL